MEKIWQQQLEKNTKTLIFKGYYRFALTQVEKGNLDFPNDLLTLRQHLETLQQQ